MKNNLAKAINKIPERDKSASVKMIDLSNHYNSALDDDIHHKPCNTLSDLPKGIQTIDGVKFDIRGLIQLSGLNSENITTLAYPAEVKNIQINQQVTKIHFLHASAWNIELPKMQIGEYLIHYQNGQTQTIPIVYRENIWDWWTSPEEASMPAAWKGQNPRTLEKGFSIRLFKLSWFNPLPELTIQSISLVSNNTGPGQLVVAVTVE